MQHFTENPVSGEFLKVNNSEGLEDSILYLHKSEIKGFKPTPIADEDGSNCFQCEVIFDYEKLEYDIENIVPCIIGNKLYNTPSEVNLAIEELIALLNDS